MLLSFFQRRSKKITNLFESTEIRSVWDWAGIDKLLNIKSTRVLEKNL